MRVAPDDDVYRVNAVWLGPRGLTFPWTARYLAYGVWLLIILLIFAVEAVTPLPMHTVPTWELSISVLLTYLVMGSIDHERPLVSVLQMLKADVTAPRAETRSAVRRTASTHSIRPRPAAGRAVAKKGRR